MTWHKIVSKELQCGMDKVSIAFFISLEYDSIAAAGLCKQKYLFVLLHTHTYFNEAVSDVIRLACVLHCAVILLISIFLLRVLCLCQRPKEIKCKAKLGPQNLTLSSQEIRRWHSTTPNIKRQKAGRGGQFPPTGILLRHKSTSSLLFNTQWCDWPPALGLLGDSPRPFSSPLASPTRKPEIRQLVMNSVNCRWLLFEKNQYYMSMYRLHHPSLNKIIDHPFPKRWCRVGYFKESRDHLKEAEFTLCRVHSFRLGDSSLCGFGCAGLVVGWSAGWWAIASRYQGSLSIKGPPVLTWQRSSAAEHGGCAHLARVYHLLGTIPGTFLACLIKPLHAM